MTIAESSSLFDDNRHAVFGAEGDGGKELEGAVIQKLDAPALKDRGEDQRGFHPGEGFADALAGAAAEGVVAPARAGGLCFRGPALRFKSQRIGEPARIAMGD